MTTIIDSDDYTASGIETMFFPGGEPHCKISREFFSDTILFAKIRTWNDYGLLLCVLEALSNVSDRLNVLIPYMPGARQDKPVKGTPDTCWMLYDLLENVAAFDTNFYTFDLHSDVIKNAFARVLMPSDLKIEAKADVVGIIAPDEGARARATDFNDKVYPDADLYLCSKQRDPHTGVLSGYHFPDLEKPGRYIIVDDICDGGGTFNLLSREWKRKGYASHGSAADGAYHLELWVSHGIFSKGIGNIDPVIEHIYTTDSWFDTRFNFPNKRVSIYKLAELFPKIAEL